jgi:hypothetical protein
MRPSPQSCMRRGPNEASKSNDSIAYLYWPCTNANSYNCSQRSDDVGQEMIGQPRQTVSFSLSFMLVSASQVVQFIKSASA